MAQVQTPYVYDDTRLKNLIIERFVQEIKDRAQNVLMMMIIFPVRNRIVIDSMFGTG
jgi:hypothetical protein